MSSAHSIARRGLSEFFDPQCPNDSKWYACPETSKSKFVGCCKIDPCDLTTGCTISNVEPVSFNASLHETPDFPPDPDCGSKDILPYTCVQGKDTFWGCCKSVPCANSPPKCNDGDLFQASLKTDMQFEAYIGAGSSSSSGGSKPANNDDKPGNDDGHVSVGIIAGATVGGVVVVVSIVAILIFCLCKKRRNKNKKNNGDKSETSSPGATPRGDFADKTEYRASTMTEAPPVYSSPNPNDGTFHPPQHKGYDQNTKGVYQQVAQTPMELSGESSMGAGGSAQKQFIAELPVDNTVLPSGSPAASAHKPVELESPVLAQAGFATPKNNPARFQEVMDTKK